MRKIRRKKIYARLIFYVNDSLAEAKNFFNLDRNYNVKLFEEYFYPVKYFMLHSPIIDCEFNYSYKKLKTNVEDFKIISNFKIKYEILSENSLKVKRRLKTERWVKHLKILQPDPKSSSL